MEELSLRLEKYKLPQLNYKVHWRTRVNQLMKSRLEKYYVTIIQAYKKVGKTTTIVEYLSRLQKRKKIHIIWLVSENLKQQNINEVKDILLELEKDPEKRIVYVVVDGLEQIQSIKVVSELFGMIHQNFENVKYILSTQGAIPSYIFVLISKQKCNLITWFQLLYGKDEMKEYLNHISPADESESMIEYPSYLFPIPCIISSCLFYPSATKKEQDFYYQVIIEEMKKVQRHLIVDEWTEEERRILSKIYIYDNITEDLIEYLFPHENMLKVANRFSERCCLFMKTGDRSYKIDSTLAKYIQVIVKEEFGEEIIRNNYQLGANYYQKKGQYKKALRFYRYSGDYEKIIRIILKNVQVVSDEREVGKLIMKLERIPMQALNEYPIVYVLLCLKEIYLFRIRKAEYWLQQLRTLFENAIRQFPLSIRQKDCVECYFTMVLLFPGNKYLDIYSKIREQVSFFCLDTCIEYLSKIRWAAYGCTYFSIIWGPKQRLVKLRYDQQLNSFLGECGTCYRELYCGFIYAMKANEQMGVYYLTKGIGRCLKNDLIDGALFGQYIDDLYFSDSSGGKEPEYGQQLCKMIERPSAAYIRKEYEAYLIQEKLFNNEEVAISRWWQENNEELRENSTFLCYRRYVTMIRVALYKQSYSKAQAWIELMIDNAIDLNAELMLVELYSLYAILWNLMKEQSKTITSIQKALNLMKRNGFYNNLSIDGVMVLKVLDLYKESLISEEKDAFLERVYYCTEKVAKRYPNYFSSNSSSEVRLTPAELGMLRELSTGKSLQEIAQTLCISLNTVKHHTKNIYSKLKVNKRMLAVEVARELGII